MISTAPSLYPETVIIPETTGHIPQEIEDEISSLIDTLACAREDEANGVPGSKERVDQCVESYAKLCKRRNKFSR